MGHSDAESNARVNRFPGSGRNLHILNEVFVDDKYEVEKIAAPMRRTLHKLDKSTGRSEVYKVFFSRRRRSVKARRAREVYPIDSRKIEVTSTDDGMVILKNGINFVNESRYTKPTIRGFITRRVVCRDDADCLVVDEDAAHGSLEPENTTRLHLSLVWTRTQTPPSSSLLGRS